MADEKIKNLTDEQLENVDGGVIFHRDKETKDQITDGQEVSATNVSLNRPRFIQPNLSEL